MNHPTKLLIQSTLRAGVRPFEAFAQVMEAIYTQAKMNPPTPNLMVGRLTRAVAVEMGVQTYPLSHEELEEVFHGAGPPKRDHGKVIEGHAKDQFEKNLRDFKGRWTDEERREKFTPKRYKRHPEKGDLKQEEIKS